MKKNNILVAQPDIGVFVWFPHVVCVIEQPPHPQSAPKNFFLSCVLFSVCVCVCSETIEFFSHKQQHQQQQQPTTILVSFLRRYRTSRVIAREIHLSSHDEKDFPPLNHGATRIIVLIDLELSWLVSNVKEKTLFCFQLFDYKLGVISLTKRKKVEVYEEISSN